MTKGSKDPCATFTPSASGAESAGQGSDVWTRVKPRFQAGHRIGSLDLPAGLFSTPTGMPAAEGFAKSARPSSLKSGFGCPAESLTRGFGGILNQLTQASKSQGMTAAAMMKIVVLDGHTLNPGDLDWSPLHSLGQCVIHPRAASADIVPRSRDADIVVTNKVPLSAETLSALPRLKFIAVTATGYNIVDVAAARARGIPVSNVPAYGTRSVAQLTVALLLELAHRTGEHAASVRQGGWSSNADWCYWNHPLIELDGKVLGIVGLGRIGRAVAALGGAFGMKVIAHSRSAVAADGIEMVDIDTLFRRSDVVSLHCPLTPETRHVVNATRLGLMKRGAFLLNTSRGPLIDEPALRDALVSGHLAGAGLDVLSVEPPPPDHPLLRAPNCIITPHIAWATHAARSRLMAVTVENLRRFVAGQPQNVVNAG